MWGDVLPVIITGALGFAGIIYTQRRADMRDRHARSNAARREAYDAFLIAWEMLTDAVEAERHRHDDLPAYEVPTNRLYYELWSSSVRVELYGTDAVVERAFALRKETARWYHTTTDDWDALSRVRDAFVKAVRQELAS